MCAYFCYESKMQSSFVCCTEQPACARASAPVLLNMAFYNDLLNVSYGNNVECLFGTVHFRYRVSVLCKIPYCYYSSPHL